MCWAHDAEGKDKENDQSRESHRGAPSRGHYLLSTEDTHSLREMQRTRPNGPIDPGHLESTRGQRQRRDKPAWSWECKSPTQQLQQRLRPHAVRARLASQDSSSATIGGI